MTHYNNDHRDKSASMTDIGSIMNEVAEHLQALAAESPRMRMLIHSLGQALIAIAAAADVPDGAATTLHASADEQAPFAMDEMAHADESGRYDAADAPASRSVSDNVTPTFVPQYVPPVYHPERMIEQVTDHDLPLIMERCWIKADAAHWTVERAQLMSSEANYFVEIEPRDRTLIERARLINDCYLWMFERNIIADDDIRLYEQLGGCFDNVASAVALLRDVLDPTEDEPPLELAFSLAAEAQSALRVAVSKLQSASDRDQVRLFFWLRDRSAEKNIFIPRFMRATNVADPAMWHNLREHIAQAHANLSESRKQRRRERNLLKKAGYHLKLISDNPHLDQQRNWQKVIDTVDELVDGGTPTSSVDIRDLLLPVIDDIPGTIVIPRHVHRVFNDIDAYLASKPSNVPVPNDSMPSAALIQARNLLRGRTVMLIGGMRRPEAADQLCAALELSELIWIETREHQTHTVFEPYVARSDVAIVLLAIRWSSHGFSEVQTFCERYRKPLVRLPSGYNPNQVAYQIVSQVSQQLTDDNPVPSHEV